MAFPSSIYWPDNETGIRGFDWAHSRQNIPGARLAQLVNFGLIEGDMAGRKGVQRLRYTQDLTSDYGLKTLHGPLGAHILSGASYAGEGTLCRRRKSTPTSNGDWLVATNKGALYLMDWDTTGGKMWYDPAKTSEYDVPISHDVGTQPLSTCQVGKYLILCSLELGVYYWDGTTFAQVPGTDGLKAKCCANIGGHIVLGNVIDGTSQEPAGLRWADVFTGSLDASLWNSGNYKTLEGGQEITALFGAGRDTDYLTNDQGFVFTDDVCHWGEITGSEFPTQATPAPGCVGPKAVADCGGNICWISTEYGPVVWKGGDALPLTDWWPRVKTEGLWGTNELRKLSVVAWSPAEQRAFFCFRNMLGGMMDVGRMFCWFPNARSPQGYFEWAEYYGYWMNDADFGEVQGGQEGLVFIDDYGFPTLCDAGYFDGAWGKYCVSVEVSATAVSDFIIAVWGAYVSPDAQKNIYLERDALAGMFLTTGGIFAGGAYDMCVRRITANSGQNDLPIMEGRSRIYLDKPLDSIEHQTHGDDPQFFLVGNVPGWWKTKEFSIGKPPRILEVIDAYVDMTPINTSNASAAVLSLRTDLVNRDNFSWTKGAIGQDLTEFVDTDGYSLPAAVLGTAIPDETTPTAVWGDIFEKVHNRFMIGGTGKYISLIFFWLSLVPTPLRISGVQIDVIVQKPEI